MEKISGMRGGRVGIVAGLALAAALLAGCQTDPSGPFAELPLDGTAPANGAGPASSAAATASATATAGPGSNNVHATDGPVGDTIRIGELVAVTFTDTPNQIVPFEEKVKEDGTITLIYNKTFHVAGKTVGEVAREIRAKYVPDYFAQMTATVRLPERLRYFYVDGEVKAPSRQLYTGPITVTQTIAACGGFTDFADKRHVKLIRSKGRVEMVNCKKAIPNPKLDLEVYPGDKIFVPRSWL